MPVKRRSSQTTTRVETTALLTRTGLTTYVQVRLLLGLKLKVAMVVWYATLSSSQTTTRVETANCPLAIERAVHVQVRLLLGLKRK